MIEKRGETYLDELDDGRTAGRNERSGMVRVQSPVKKEAGCRRDGGGDCRNRIHGVEAERPERVVYGRNRELCRELTV